MMCVGEGKLIDGMGRVIHEGLFERGSYISGHSMDAEGNPVKSALEQEQENMRILDDIRQQMAKTGSREMSEKEVKAMMGDRGSSGNSKASDTMKNRKPLK